MLKVILDTNILISIFLFSRRIKQTISPLINEKKIEVIFSEETLDELSEVLAYKKFAGKFRDLSITPGILVNAFLTRENVFVVKNPLAKDRSPILKKDPTDDKFLLLAESVRAKYIVSGDKVLLEHKKYKGVEIVSASEFIKLFSK